LAHLLERVTAKDHGPVRGLDVMVSKLLFERKKSDIYFQELTNLSYGKMHLLSRLQIMRTVLSKQFNAIYAWEEKIHENRVFWSLVGS